MSIVFRAGLLAALSLGLALAIPGASAQRPGKGPPPGKGKGNDPAFAADRDGIHYLLASGKEVTRTVTETKTGVETVTQSDKPEVAKKIQEHVAAMHARVKNGTGIHLRDPLFAELFKHHDKIDMTVEKTEKGVKVTESSSDPYVVKLIQEHAKVVTRFIENGHDEARKNHTPPERTVKKP